MLIPASSEFIALCRSQVALLAEGLGAVFSVVYLAEELVEEAEAKLIPVVVYPETSVIWEETQTLGFLPEQMRSVESLPRLLLGTSSSLLERSQSTAQDSSSTSDKEPYSDNALWRQRQIVLPLIHEGVVMGLLVTRREDRPWNDPEKQQIEEIVHTLSLGCAIDRQRAWFEQRLHQQQRFQAQQHELLDDLLHQFRNPLTALRTFGKLLIKRLRSDDPNRNVATGIVRESDRLQELLQEFDAHIDSDELDLAPLALPGAAIAETQASPYSLLPTSIEACAVTEILEQLLASASAIAQERNIDLVSDLPPDFPLVQANSKALREILSNLIDNALKYTPSGGQVQIQIGTKPEPKPSAVIAISDTGYGIPTEDLEHLFERHYRGVQAQGDIPGTGLGLAIAKELLEKMQGDIKVISPALFNWTSDRATQTVGAGTTVIVCLPLIE